MALASGVAFTHLDTDLPVLVAALADVGVAAEVVVWDAEVDWSRFDAVVIRSVWDYVDRRDGFLAWTDRVERATRLANPAATIRWNSDKRYLADLAAAGVPVVPTAWPRDGAAIPADWTDVVVKPAVSAGARWTGRFADAGAAQTFADTLLARGEDPMVQRYVRSVDAIGETAVYCFGGLVSHAIRKSAVLVAGAAPRADASLAEAQSYGPVALDDAPVDFARAVLDEIPEVASLLYARVDCVTDDAGNDMVIEVELIEPALFLDTSSTAAAQFAAAVAAWLSP